MARYEPSYLGERRTSAVHVQLTPAERAEFEAAAASAGVASLSAFARFLFFHRLFEAGALAATRRNPDAFRLAVAVEYPQPGNACLADLALIVVEDFETRLCQMALARSFQERPWDSATPA